jgi:hypothetical protein
MAQNDRQRYFPGVLVSSINLGVPAAGPNAPQINCVRKKGKMTEPSAELAFSHWFPIKISNPYILIFNFQVLLATPIPASWATVVPSGSDWAGTFATYPGLLGGTMKTNQWEMIRAWSSAPTSPPPADSSTATARASPIFPMSF